MFSLFLLISYIALLKKIKKTVNIISNYRFLFVILVLALLSFQEPNLKKRIADKEFKYEFYVTNKEPSIKSDRMYYWFKGGSIHNSENGVSGELLNEDFEKFYLSNQLAEKGEFSRGLKVGLWKTWHPNGVIESTQYWSDGRKKGMYYQYNQDGVLIEKGRYSANKKQGMWVNFISKDSIKYKNGEKVIKVIDQEAIAREAKRAENQAKRKANRKTKREAKKIEKELKKTESKAKEAVSKSEKEATKKGNSETNTSGKKPIPKAK